MNTDKLITARGNGIFAVVGRDEIELSHEFYPKDLCFITISDPSKEFIDVGEYFKDKLELKFWDIEEPFANYDIITDNQAREIREFILKNKDEHFLINCEAGVSRSAAIGLAVEYLTRDLELYPEWIQFPRKILQHWRYTPNMTVFNKIIN